MVVRSGAPEEPPVRPPSRADELEVVVAVLAYEAAAHVEGVLDRVPVRGPGWTARVLVADDASSDRTADLARRWAADHPDLEVEVVGRPQNLGYGGNQKACIRWAAQHGADVVVLLHGDGQYPAERIGELLGALRSTGAAAAFGDRMHEWRSARAGGMPWVRVLGNRVLSTILDRLADTEMSEWFNGFRAYRLDALGELPLDAMSDGFDFDVEVALALLARGAQIVEVPMPTRYGEEVSRVPLLRTGAAVVRHGWRHRRAARSKGER